MEQKTLAIFGLLVSGVTSLTYNFNDEIAQSVCTSATPGQGYVYAIRRDCRGVTPTCDDICAGLADQMLKDVDHTRTIVECFDALLVAKTRPQLEGNSGAAQPDQEMLGLKTYRYYSNGCSWPSNHCGPNYCCCLVRN